MSSEVIFAEAVLASLRRQRSLSSPFCDVLVRCGNVTLATHGSVLAAVSRFFEKILMVSNPPAGSAVISHQKLVDVSSMFVGIESLFTQVIDSLYVGKLTWPSQYNQLLKSVYDSLDLKVDFSEEQTFESEFSSSPVNQLDQGQQLDEVFVSGPEDVILGSVSADELQVAELFVQDGPELTVKSRPGKEVTMNMSVCPKCDLLFMSKEEFLTHRSSHCTRRIACQTCVATFPRVQNLVSHLIEVRHGEMECSVCGFDSKSQKDLEVHLNRHADSMDKPYFCSHCDARFSTRKRWLQHLPKHSSEAPFVCPTCGKCFKWKHALTAHLVIHATDKKFLCQECGFSTCHASTLRFHTRMHAGNLMKCDVKDCTFQTTRKSNLVQHQLTHSKEKPHQCEVCGRSFSLAKNMRRHARQHGLTASSYTCTEADCTFSSLRSDKFYEHVKKYHTPTVTTVTTNIAEIESATAAPQQMEAMMITASPVTTIRRGNPFKASRLEKSPFNMVSPPNKTIIDAMHGTFSDQVPIEEPSADLAEGKIMMVDDDLSEHSSHMTF